MGNSGNRRPDYSYVNGPSTEDKTSGDHINEMPLSRARLGERDHGMKGILGRLRGETYVPSDYSSGDKGGSAGGYGLSHGIGGDVSTAAPSGMPEQKYQGGELGFEGGVRGGGDFETMPGAYPYPEKKGFDEHQQVGAPSSGGIHGRKGVDGMGEGTEMSDSADSDSNGEMDGFSCPHGCGSTMKSMHGVARHVSAKHGGFKGLGHAIAGTMHGSSYPPNKETRGETEDAPEMKQITGEYARAKAMIGNDPSTATFSSYRSSDRGGAYGNYKK